VEMSLSLYDHKYHTLLSFAFRASCRVVVLRLNALLLTRRTSVR